MEGAGGGVQPEVGEGQPLEGGRLPLALPPGEGAQTGQQLLRGEGLGHVVVRAAVQPLHLVRHPRPGGEHQDGQGIPLLPEGAAHPEAVQPGEHHVQHRRAVAPGPGQGQPRGAVRRRVRLPAPVPQELDQGLRQPGLVLHHQHLHGRASSQSMVTVPEFTVCSEPSSPDTSRAKEPSTPEAVPVRVPSGPWKDTRRPRVTQWAR